MHENVVTVVTLSSLTETIPLAMLFPFCCQVSTTENISVFLLYLNLTKFTKKSSETGSTFALFYPIKPTKCENIN